MNPLKIGDKAPELKIPASNGKTVTLKDFAGKNVVLYFYPKDDTPGCTVEACGFRDAYNQIQKQGAVILGVSPDSLGKHERFIKKFELPFLLLADEDHALAERYGVWGEKSLYGRKYFGVERTTFIIGKDNTIKAIFPKVKPQGHEAEILAALKTL